VFAESRQLIEMAGRRLEEAGIVTRYIVGGMTEDQRYNATNDFQEGRARAILLTFKAGGEGITLTRANQIAFLQRSWSMLNNKQAEDRVHRIGSEIHRSITITDFVAPDTVEVDQIRVLHEKFDRLQEIVRDRETLQAAAQAGNTEAAAKLAQLELEETTINSVDDFVSLNFGQLTYGDDDA
jgi:SNF2 family DNA or RNA helicase